MKQGFKELAAQMAAIWKQLGLNQRISLGLATGAVIAGLAALVVFSSRTSYSLLYGGLEEAEAGRVIAALDDAKVPYRVRGSGNIYVPADQQGRMRIQLAAKGLGVRGRVLGNELLDQPSFGITESQQRANLRRALEGELSRTIEEIDAIESARVHLDIPEHRLLIDTQQKPKASVLVHVRGSATLPDSTVNAVRFIVANSVQGLSVGNVSVADTNGHISGNDDEQSPGGLVDRQLRIQTAIESRLTRDAAQMLNWAVGPGQYQVVVRADINWDSLTEYNEKYDPEGQVMRSSTINDEQTQTSSAPRGGVPGIASNLPAEGTNSVGSTTAAAPVTTSKETKKVTQTQFEVNRTVTSLLKSPGAILRRSASVLVARKYEGTGANRKAVPRRDLEDLRKAVRTAVGIVEGEPGRNDEITLVEVDFDNSQELELTQQLDRQQTRQFWTELGLKLLYPALGLLVIYLLWRGLRGARTEDISLGIPLGDLVAAPVEEPGHSSPRPHRNGEPKVVTVEVLNQLIRENPSNMTHAVRAWLTRGKPAK